MKTAQRVSPLNDIGGALVELLDAQVRLGMRFMETLADRPASRMIDAMQRVGPAAGRGCCEIPEPCWMPQSLGELRSHACPGGMATVRIVVTNCDRVARTLTIQPAGPTADRVRAEPAALTLGPKERATFVVHLAIPEEAHDCEELEALIWVRGCQDHYLRWIVRVGKHGGDCCHEIEVDDCPDLVHHWYDHFYCVRPCYGGGREGGNVVGRKDG